MEIRRCIGCMEDMGDTPGAFCPHCGYNNSDSAPKQPYAMRPNTLLHGRYLVGKVLGQGGFGITYIGFDMVLNIKVAIKEYFPMGSATREGNSSTLRWNSMNSTEQRQGAYESFLKEARKTAKLDQVSAIVRVRDTFYDNETAYIIMDYVEGTTLKEKMLKEGVMPFSACIKLLTPLMEGLVKVHEIGLVHRDISPDNIMVQPDGSVKLLDLGAAKDMSVNQGPQSQLVTKNGFSPLEQYTESGQVGPWTDVYAMSATIYYCITGKLLPSALDRMSSPELNFSFPMKEALPASAAAALKAGLAVDQRNRTRNISDLLKQLNGAAPINAAPAGDPYPATVPVSPSPVPSAGPAPAPAGNSAPPQTPAGGNTSQPAGGKKGKEKKKSGKKKLIAALAVVAAAALVFVIVTVVRNGGAQKSYIPAMADGEEQGKYAVLGNSAGNLMNMGYCATWDGVDYYISDDCSALYSVTSKGSEEILSREEDSLWELSAMDGALYYIYSGCAYTYDIADEKEKEISALKDFGGSIQRLYVTERYFVIYCSDGGIYRVSKRGGNYDWCGRSSYPNGFTLSEDGWIYSVVKTDEGYPQIERVNLSTLEVDANGGINYPNTSFVFINPLEVDGEVYVLCYDTKAIDQNMSIYRFSDRLDLNDSYVEYKINWSDLDQMSASTYYFYFNVNKENYDIYLCQMGYDSNNNLTDGNIYRLKMGERGGFDEFDLVAENAWMPQILYYKDKGIELLYQQRESRRDEWKIGSKRFDADGKEIDK